MIERHDSNLLKSLPEGGVLALLEMGEKETEETGHQKTIWAVEPF